MARDIKFRDLFFEEYLWASVINVSTANDLEVAWKK
jgi:hypothetical protein